MVTLSVHVALRRPKASNRVRNMGNPKAKKGSSGGKKKGSGAVRAPNASVLPGPEALAGALDWGAKEPTADAVSKGNPATVAWTLREFGQTSAELAVAALQRAVELCKVSNSDASKENRQALLSAEQLAAVTQNRGLPSHPLIPQPNPFPLPQILLITRRVVL